ncbi:MAG: hypothetical protein M1556_05995 [Candidatus Thermoplasmatota archaeon]|jgi:hypothetical protein|nr:hypothetical protein [Candidatus Thermoplasmatota archaeon]MCL6003174.1 hypothetical protein [Candidatus Thermoplasmatota archaeon]
MRKNLLIIGIVLLVVGVAMAGISTVEAAHSVSSSIGGAGNTMYPGTNGDYYSNNLNVSTGDEVLVVSNIHAYLIPSSDISTVNSGNVGSYAISPSTSAGNTSTYTGLLGSFYVVTFGTSSPSVSYAVVSGGLGHLIITGLLVLGGAFLAIAGIVIAIIGALLKPKNRPVQQF